MKKLILTICVCALFFACKKDQVDDITAYNWVLTKATINPAKMYNGKMETDLMKMDPSTCLNNNYTINFGADGVYSFSSSGPLCDMFAGDKSQKWSKEGDNVTLTNAFNNTTVAKLTSNMLTYTITFNDGNAGTNYTSTYIYTAKSK